MTLHEKIKKEFELIGVNDDYPRKSKIIANDTNEFLSLAKELNISVYEPYQLLCNEHKAFFVNSGIHTVEVVTAEEWVKEETFKPKSVC